MRMFGVGDDCQFRYYQDGDIRKVMQVTSDHFGGMFAKYRPNTTDERVLHEVLEKRVYRRVRIGFDVEEGETWLDLGANIGAFALYCKLRGATATCYEPEPAGFSLLRENVPEFKCARSAVTTSRSTEVPFYMPNDVENLCRGTVYPMLRNREVGTVPNVFIDGFRNMTFDGVKMDIEGAEMDILDRGVLPICEKLVLEYHTSRDGSIENLETRLAFLKSKFKEVDYPPEFDRLIQEGIGKPYFDRLIFCKGRK